MSALELVGERVRLRGWRSEDLEPYLALLAEPEVAEWLGGFDGAMVRERFPRMAAGLEERGWGLWPVEDAAGELIGAVGVAPVPVESGLPFAPAVEAAWRLKRSAWGQGLATEAVRLALAHAAGLPQLAQSPLVSFTAETNLRSQSVMRKLGFERDPAGDFDHPALPEGHPLRRHVLFRRAWTPPQARTFSLGNLLIRD